MSDGSTDAHHTIYDEDVTCESVSEPISGSVSEEISESEWVRVRVTSRDATHVKRNMEGYLAIEPIDAIAN